ncbi:hypothetical protein UY3_15425 [Chelonia mydas]|uniref:Uncharacterized protein n=1 Tax=Chelonia mydas TaxID=8469 RepID=M7AWR0_CHEMY|nr:hypothetical protein UY3_15425 [Chelonia mydas]
MRMPVLTFKLRCEQEAGSIISFKCKQTCFSEQLAEQECAVFSFWQLIIAWRVKNQFLYLLRVFGSTEGPAAEGPEQVKDPPPKAWSAAGINGISNSRFAIFIY